MTRARLRQAARVGLRLVLPLTFVLASIWTLAPVSGAVQGPCEFQLGFLLIKQGIPTEVGDCLENEYFNTANGNAEQHTTARGAGGLLVWRKSDNWTAFTDGYRTWVNGPFGIQERLNTERFPYESDPPVTPTPIPAATPEATAAPTATATPVVTATPNVPTVYISWTIDGNGNPSGYWRDQAGVTVNFGSGQSGTISVRFNDRIVLDPVSNDFSLLFDCGAGSPAISPCNFNASNKGSLPTLQVINRGQAGGYLTISRANNYGGTRPDNSTNRYVNDPKVTLFLNPNPR